ncbi:MAG: hypothetical protein N2Z21_08725 [Candidatus Sumerlaeaceae bacterium]|nr:hypothetical protein [Candidatus Sumerlaeaceae bacterium]
MKSSVFAVVALAVAAGGCQKSSNVQAADVAPSKNEAAQTRMSTLEPQQPPTQSPRPTTVADKKAKKLGPKATAESYELTDACKILSGTVLRIMHFATIKGELKADKPPKTIRFVVEGSNFADHHPVVKVGVYDPAAQQWRELETFTAKGKSSRRYPLANIPAGTVAFHVRYEDIDPHDGSKVRPDLFVHSAELEF